MRTAIRKHLRDFAAIIGLMAIAIAVASVILSNQRLSLPAWVPVIGKDFYEIKAELQTAQAVTPGQGQTVNIAGVEVGEIASVKLVNGRAIIGLKIEPKHAKVYRDATILMRPKTGLKDMVAELTPGTAAAGRLPEGGTIPVLTPVGAALIGLSVGQAIEFHTPGHNKRSLTVLGVSN